MAFFSVKFICKFQVIKEYKLINQDQRKSLIRKCIDIARKKNSFESSSTCINDEIFREIKTANDGKLGILEVDSGNIIFKEISGNHGSTKKTFHHRIENIALVCQSYPNPLYVGYLSQESEGLTLIYIYFSNTQAQAAYKCISNGFNKNCYNIEQTSDETCNYVSMCGKVYKMPKHEDRIQNKQLQCTSKDPLQVPVNNSLMGNGTFFSLENPPIDDGDISIPIRNTYVIEILNNIPRLEIINYLKQKYEVKILSNSILVEHKQYYDTYEKMD